jgi:fatty-acyl-CoA synthase
LFRQLHPGVEISTENLQASAPSNLVELPTWPKEIHVVETFLLTTVAKIYKVSLRCDAAKLRIADLVHNELGLPMSDIDVIAPAFPK